jgi:Mn-dependent DtxR family transcriptional regulator
MLPHLDIPYSGKRDSDIEELDEVELKLIKLFEGGEALDADRIAKLLQIGAADIASMLMMLELKGYVAKRLDGSYEAVSRYS